MVTLGGAAEALCSSQNGAVIKKPNSTDLGIALQRPDTTTIRITIYPFLANYRAQTLGKHGQRSQPRPAGGHKLHDAPLDDNCDKPLSDGRFRQAAAPNLLDTISNATILCTISTLTRACVVAN